MENHAPALFWKFYWTHVPTMIQCERTTQGYGYCIEVTGCHLGGCHHRCLPKHFLLSCLSALLQLREKPGDICNDPGREADPRSLQVRKLKAQRRSAVCLTPCALAPACTGSNQSIKSAEWILGICKPTSLTIYWPLTLHLCLCSSWHGPGTEEWPNVLAKPCALPSTAPAPAQSTAVQGVGRQD